MSASQPTVRGENEPVSFPHWQVALRRAALLAAKRDAYRQEIFTFLRHCRTRRAPATIMLVKQYLAERERQGANGAREALRWFFRSAPSSPHEAQSGEQDRRAADGRERLRPAPPGGSRKPALSEGEILEVAKGGTGTEATDGPNPASGYAARDDVRRSAVPPLAARDQGGANWERDLIAAMRARGLLWRTEETYRGWARRFAEFLAPRSPYACDAADIGAFLSMLAVTQRASRSSQKQALNAIVFLVQEALKRQLGEIKFRRAPACRAVPTVLSREECKRLFDQLNGTTRLMAELAYGAGLRLLELLRLRVHHLDLARQQLQVYDGKGAKHRLTVLPAVLMPALAAHLERLRVLYAEDRAAGLPGCGCRKAWPGSTRRREKPGNGSGCSHRGRRPSTRSAKCGGDIT